MKTIIESLTVSAAIYSVLFILIASIAFGSELNFNTASDSTFTPQEIVFEEESYIDDIPFDTKSIAENYRLEEAINTNFDFEEEAYEICFSANYDCNSNVLRYGYSSMTTPNSYFDFDMNTQETKLLKEQKIIGNFNKENYETKRYFAPAKDGTRIPISVVYKKGIKLDGNNPLLIYGYSTPL